MDNSLFVSTDVHKRIVNLNGKDVELYFKELTSVQLRYHGLVEESDDLLKRAENMAKLVSLSLCNEDGSPAITFEKAKTLKPKPLLALVMEVFAVSGQGDDAGK